MSMKDFLQSLAERLHYTASVKTAFGEPIEAQGRMIIPVARVAYGLGGGASLKTGSTREAAGGEAEDGAPQTGGGGIIVTPIGVVEVLAEETRFVPLGGAGKQMAATFLAGMALGLLLRRGGKGQTERSARALRGRERR
jgi:uncharacterized spore protein YtfJ